MKPYRFLKEAYAEFQEHVTYFDEQAPSVTDQFVADVYAAVRAIREYPEIGSPMTRTVRKMVLRAFRYNVLYVNGLHEIIIVAVAPHKRRPGYWRKRLRNPRY